MTTGMRIKCANTRSSHFGTKSEAEAEVLTRKIRDSRIRRATPRVRDVEFCTPCEQWIIVSPSQREHRRQDSRVNRRGS